MQFLLTPPSPASMKSTSGYQVYRLSIFLHYCIVPHVISELLAGIIYSAFCIKPPRQSITHVTNEIYAIY